MISSGFRFQRFLRSGALAAAGALMLWSAPLSGQTSTGTIRGTITGEGGAPVAEAQVTARNVASGVQRGTVSREDGSYILPGLTPGEPDTYSDPIAAEFVATGISSSGLPADLAAAVQSLFTSYPHVAYFVTVTRGYLRHAVTRDEWRADVRFVESVLTPVSPVRTEVSFVAEHGVLVPEPA